jgi:uncharacterized SAM-binding protein YcdF (DUF218 family)
VLRFLVGFLLGALTLFAVLAGIGHYLDVSDPLAKADAIVAISGDTGARLETAVELWKAGYAPRLILSGSSSDPQSVPSAELMRRSALAQGVPASAVVVEGESATTEENAVRVTRLMSALELRSAILVTSPYHQRRAAMLFAREFGRAGIALRNHPADDPSWDPNTWWTHDSSRAVTLIELAKLAALVAEARGS